MNTSEYIAPRAVQSALESGIFDPSGSGEKCQLTLLDRCLYDRLKKPGDVTEIRVLGASGNSRAWAGFAKGTVTGYFDNHEAMCKAITALKGIRYEGVYFTPQLIDPRLIGRACNRLVAAKETTADHNVLAYRFLLVDLDPVRPAGISSSEAELAAALQLRDEIAPLISADYDLPDPMRAVSGNGGHLLYPVPDLPAADNQPVFKHILEQISTRFSTEQVQIDLKVFNPARIWKAYGTFARKGDPVPTASNRDARPHRMAYVDHLPPQELGQ